MRILKNNRGISVVAVVIMMLILAAMGTVMISLVATESQTSIQQMRASQAQSAAEGGMEYALYQFKNGTACASLTNSNVALGSGTFTTSGTLYNPASTSLSGAITNSVTTIPLTSSTGYAPHGRITIDSETIDYSGVSGNSLTGAIRGANNTTAAAHSSGASVPQNQCIIQSTGTITGSFGNSVRVVEAAATSGGGPSSSAISDGISTAIGTAATTIGTLATTFSAGDNLIVAVIALRASTNGAAVTIAAGNLKIVKGGSTLVSSAEPHLIGPAGSLDAKNFPQGTQFLLYKDTGAAANPTYTLTAQASATGLLGEVKMIAINGAPYSSFQSGVETNIPNAVNTTLLTHNSNVPAGNNLVIAAVALYSDIKAGQTVAVGNLKLVKGAATLASNQVAIYLAKPGEIPSTGYLLLYRDAGAAANPTYSITCLETTDQIKGAAQIIVLNGLSGAYLETGSTLVSISNKSKTTIGTLNTAFTAGESVAIATDHLFKTSGKGNSNLPAGNQEFVAGATITSNQFDVDLCNVDVACEGLPTGNLLRLTAGAANQTFLTRAQAADNGISAESKILAIRMDGTGGGQLRIVDWKEVP